MCIKPKIRSGEEVCAEIYKVITRRGMKVWLSASEEIRDAAVDLMEIGLLDVDDVCYRLDRMGADSCAEVGEVSIQILWRDVQ